MTSRSPIPLCLAVGTFVLFAGLICCSGSSNATQKSEAKASLPASDQLAALKKLGVTYDTDADGQVIEITLHKKKVTAETWKLFKSFPNLETLDLDETGIKDADLAHITKFKKLQVLSIQKNPITDDGLKHIKDMKSLENLALEKTKVTAKGLAHIQGLVNIKTLNLSQCKIGDDGLKHLVKMTGMETLALRKSGVQGPGLAHIGKLKEMITLTLTGSKIEGDSMLHLKGLDKLRIINMYDCEVSKTSIEKLEAEIPTLAVFQ